MEIKDLNMKKASRFDVNNVLFLECDIQEIFSKHIMKYNVVLHNAKRLTRVAEALDIPVIATCQNKKKLKGIDPAIPKTEERRVFDKTQFSMLTSGVWHEMNLLPGRTQVVLYGIEAHVCMRQTCLDLLKMSYDVHVVVDACSSMNNHDRNTGIQSMRDAGAQLISVETVIFELTRDAKNPIFKSLQPIIKDKLPRDSNGMPETLDL